MGVLMLSSVLLFVILIMTIWVTSRRRRGAEALAEAGLEMKAAFAKQLQTIVPHIYNRLDLITKVPKVGLWKRLKLQLVVQLTTEDLLEIQPMVKEFLDDYLVVPGNRDLRVLVTFLPLKG